MLATLRVPAVLLVGSIALAGCAGSDIFGGGAEQVTTSSVAAQAPKMDPACPSLQAQIDNLRKDGVADKVEKAAAKKYKMTPVDIAKADQLNKANADFQNKCSTLPRSAAAAPVAPVAAAMPAAPAAGVPAAQKAAPAVAGAIKSAEAAAVKAAN